MPDIRLTKGNDDYTQLPSDKSRGDNIYGDAGDDIIRTYSGNIVGGAGNDTLQFIPTPNEPWWGVTAAYWDSPNKVVVDLQAGWALDGWGGKDTLIGIESASAGWVETEFYGTNNANNFWIGGRKNTIDGRGGDDRLWLPGFSSTPPVWSDFKIKVSVDGTSAFITVPGQAEFSLTMKNVENLVIWDGNAANQRPLTDFIDIQDLAIDGLVQGLGNRWNASSAVGTAIEVSFSFVKKAPSSGVGSNQFRAFTVDEQTAVKKILTNLSSFTGLTFKEVDESGGQNGSIRFGVSQQLNTKGTTNFPGENGDAAGDIWMDVESMLNLAPGSEGYAALLHEIGHALGLRHTKNVDPADHYDQQFYISYDLTSYTVMSQTLSPDGLFPSTWQAIDISALRYLYGSKAVNSSDNILVLGSAQANSETSIIDDGGIDTLDAYQAAVGVSLDLNAGHLSSFGVTSSGIPAVNNISIAKSTLIENAVGSNFDDVLLGNELNNQLTGGKGNDWIDGGGGTDTAIFSGPRSDYFLSAAFGKTFVSSRDGGSGFDTLINIEKLKFSDQTISISQFALGSDLEITVDLGGSISSTLPPSNDLLTGTAIYKIQVNPSNGDLVFKPNGEFTYTPKSTSGAYDSFTYSLSDSKGNSNVYTVFVQIHGDTQNVNGSPNADQIVGTNFSDFINGLAGEDIISGAGGNDVIDGGAGADTATYSGKLADYTVIHSGSTFIVHSKTGAEGNDTLTNVEQLKFNDLTVNLSVQQVAAAAPQANVQRLIELYVAFFNRVPDADGLAYWIGEMQHGKAVNEVADIFYGAGVQFTKLTGFSATMSNSDFINVIYKNVLGRADGADAGGLSYWNSQLATGVATRGSLVSTILDAAHSFKGDATFGWVADLLDNKIAVARTFAIDWGLGYANSDDAIRHGMEIAAAVTPTDARTALNLVGIVAADLSLY